MRKTPRSEGIASAVPAGRPSIVARKPAGMPPRCDSSKSARRRGRFSARRSSGVSKACHCSSRAARGIPRPSASRHSWTSVGRANGPIHQTGFSSARTRSRTSASSDSTSSGATFTPLTEAHVGPCRMHTRSSAKRSTLAPGAMCEKRSGVSAYSRSSGERLSAARRWRGRSASATCSRRAPPSAHTRSAPCSCHSADRCRVRTSTSPSSR